MAEEGQGQGRRNSNTEVIMQRRRSADGPIAGGTGSQEMRGLTGSQQLSGQRRRSSQGSVMGMLQLTTSGKLEEKAAGAKGGTGQTISDVFLSGRASQENAPIETRSVLSLQGAGGFECEFFPDPPCILPFPRERDLLAGEDEQGVDMSLHEYWRKHASHIDIWPALKPAREGLETFANQWKELPEDSPVRPYVVLAPSPVGVRRKPSSEEADKTGKELQPGQCVIVDQILEKDEVFYLRLLDKSGWVFTTKSDEAVMGEMTQVVVGPWWYRITCDEYVESRRMPCYDDESRTGWVLSPSETAVVLFKCHVHGYPFVALQDGRGWLFEMKPGVNKNCRDAANMVMRSCEDTFLDNQVMDLKSLVLPTDEIVEVGRWTYVVGDKPMLAVGTSRFGTIIKPGEILKVDKRALCNGNPCSKEDPPTLGNRQWLRLIDGRGWVPERSETGMLLANIVDPTAQNMPHWQLLSGADGGAANMAEPEDWMTGVA